MNHHPSPLMDPSTAISPSAAHASTPLTSAPPAVAAEISEVTMADTNSTDTSGSEVSEEPQKTLAEIIAHYRQSGGYTLAELAENFRKPTRTIERWASGQHVPNKKVREDFIRTIDASGPSRRSVRDLQKLHNLTWDASRRRWKLRLTLGMGKKLVGKRLTLHIRGTVEEAIAKRDAIIAAYRLLGLTVEPRLQKRVAKMKAKGGEGE